jgi:hypothetical protein
MHTVRTYFLSHIVNSEKRRYNLDSSVTSCLEVFVKPFAETTGKPCDIFCRKA